MAPAAAMPASDPSRLTAPCGRGAKDTRRAASAKHRCVSLTREALPTRRDTGWGCAAVQPRGARASVPLGTFLKFVERYACVPYALPTCRKRTDGHRIDSSETQARGAEEHTLRGRRFFSSLSSSSLRAARSTPRCWRCRRAWMRSWRRTRRGRGCTSPCPRRARGRRRGRLEGSGRARCGGEVRDRVVRGGSVETRGVRMGMERARKGGRRERHLRTRSPRRTRPRAAPAASRRSLRRGGSRRARGFRLWEVLSCRSQGEESRRS